MTIMVGLDNAHTAQLRAAIAGGTLERGVIDFLQRAVLPQSPGWQLHTRAACAILDICANTLRRLKGIVATLPGIRRVFFRSMRGQVYEGLLLGDYIEGAGYPVVSWVDEDGVIRDGFPPKIEPVNPTSSSTATAPQGHAGGAGSGRPPREPKGWRRFEAQARTVVAKTPARSVRGVAMIIRWAVEDEGHDVEDVVARLVRLGDGIGVTKAALQNDYSPANAPQQQPVGIEPEREAREPNVRRSCEVSVALRPVLDTRPELAPGAAVLEALAQYRRVTATAMEADRWLQEIHGDIGDFTAAEAYEAVDRVQAAGRPLTAEWIARGIRAVRA